MPEILSATEQSTFNTSVVSITTFPPDNNSKELPAGIVTSLTKNDVVFATLLAPPLFEVLLSNSTSTVIYSEWMLFNIKPRTTVVVELATVYIL